MKKNMLCCILLLYVAHLQSEKAVVIVPVADLVGQPLCTANQSNSQPYDNLPFCGASKRPGIACPRIHQLLYNDVVDVIKTTEYEACIAITHAVYYVNQQPQTRYWTLKKNLVLLSDLEKYNINHSSIPEPINYSDPMHTALHNENIITLQEPYYDKKSSLTFSAGTRFVRKNKQNNNQCISVLANDYYKPCTNTLTIPLHKCIVGSKKLSPTQRIANYISLLKKWAHNNRGIIAYTWGGTSVTSTINEAYTEVNKQTPDGEYSYYEFKKYKPTQKTGLDCSGAALRAAQICGIPYFCKNSSSIAHNLQPLTKNTILEAGDIFVTPGHVMIISDIQNNLLIEACAYSHGYGKLHEVPISQVFDGIQSYSDLLDAYYNKKPLRRKTKDGTLRNFFNSFTLLKMNSAWK